MNQIVVRRTRTTSNVPSAKVNWKWFQRAGLVALLVLGAGCSGIHASKSVSPLDFILPGLMKYETAPAGGTNAPARAVLPA